MSFKCKLYRTLSCVDLYCPEPIFRTRIELNNMVEGEVLIVLADGLSAEEDIKNLVNLTGHQLFQIRNKEEILYTWPR